MESQDIEWKESWRDESLQWICAFANAQGGRLEIGRNDDGEIIGLTDAEKLLEVLPNKIRNATGVLADVDIHDEDDKQYIVITVKPYPASVSYRGRYYYRSGSTTQELTGSALDEFMLRKQGKTWDGVPVPYVTEGEFHRDAFMFFRRKALESTHLSKEDLAIDDEALLQNLMLTEGKYLKRAAMLLFHQNPEKWVPGAYVKIGYFENGADLLYQDEIHGPLISMPDKVLDTLYLKYFKGYISYRGIQRIETYPVARSALREAVLNAVVHKDYGTGVPIQIKVYPDKGSIYNTGGLPEGWTIEKLLTAHGSNQRNPMIAGSFFRSGMIEAWGRGIEKIITACSEEGKPAPVFEASGSEMMITFIDDRPQQKALNAVATGTNIEPSGATTETEQDETRVKVELVSKLIEAREKKGISQRQLAEMTGLRQPAIARLESMGATPQIDTFLKVLKPLGYTLVIVPDQS
jgi:ATP-dependent DNA helicase RecG